jgi:hypothetical protein
VYRSREDLAWAAGFFEGEGCFDSGPSRNPEWRRPIISISQVNREPLDRFQQVMGFGKVYGPYPPRRPNDAPLHRYQTAKYEYAQATVCLLWPWLTSQRRGQALRMLRRGQWHIYTVRIALGRPAMQVALCP